MKLTDRVRLYVRLQLPSGQIEPDVHYASERPVSHWISHVFDGPRQYVLDVWLSPIGSRWDPTAMQNVSAEFALCVAEYLSERAPENWPSDMEAFCERHHRAAERLDALRRQHEAEIAAGPWRTPDHPDKQDAWRGL